MTTVADSDINLSIDDRALQLIIGFLQDAFTSAELRRLLFVCGGDVVLSELPDGGLAETAYHCAKLLRRHRQLGQLRVELLRLRSARAMEIEELFRPAAPPAPLRPVTVEPPREGHPTRAALRKTIMKTLKSDADFDAFCLDHFPAVYERFSDGMQRVAKVTHLLLHAELPAIAQALGELPVRGTPVDL